MICNINRHLRTDVQVATKVSLMPKSDADYAALSLSSQAAEESSVLSQVAVVSAGMSFPLWVDANKQQSLWQEGLQTAAATPRRR